jgi:transcriptional regulator with PAS, ATPase and Fis domain
VPQTLAESELLGHKRGAFSDAKEDKAGHFERAHRGTIFLDEIGVLHRELQEKLLKPIAEKEITPLGSQRSMTVDMKVVAATNTDLQQAVVQGTFRADLYRRLNEYTIELPPLRERPEDIPLLACYFLDTYARQYNKGTRGFSHTAMQQLGRYHWPGNVGELESSIKAAVSTGKEALFSWDVPATIRQTPPARERGKPKSVEEVEKEHIMEVLEFTKGNKTQAAAILGYRTTQTLYNKLDNDGIPRNYGSPR